MTSKQILDMISEIIKEIDYDIWKDIYIYDNGNETETVADIFKIVKKYMGE